MEGHFPCNFGFISLANNLVEFSKRLPSPHHFKNCFSVVSQPLYTIAGYRLLLNGSWCAWKITTGTSTESVITGGLATAASRTERKIQVRLPKEQGGEERLCQKIVEFLGPPHTQLFPCFYTKHSSPRTPITYDPSFRPRADHLLNLCFACCFAGLCPRLSSWSLPSLPPASQDKPQNSNLLNTTIICYVVSAPSVLLRAIAIFDRLFGAVARITLTTPCSFAASHIDTHTYARFQFFYPRANTGDTAETD